MLRSRDLNRALLARQLLLERHPSSAVETIQRLVGLQAQAPLAPYVGLWARLIAFDPADLADAIEARQVVRASVMRSTIHLVTADDALALRSWTQPVLTRGFAASPFARRSGDIEVDALVARGREILQDASLSRVALGRTLAERWPDGDQEAMAYAVASNLPLVQVPPRGIWGRSGPVAWTSMEGWLGRTVPDRPDPDTIVTRYLAAFGPASVMDIQAWSGVTRLHEVVERLRPGLATFRDEAGRELFDLPGASRPAPDTQAPPRFLPEYDNVLLGHADRSRIIPVGRAIPLPPGNGASMGTILLDGMYGGLWRIVRSGTRATLTIDPFAPIPHGDLEAVEVEGANLLSFAAAGLDGDIVIRAPTS